MEAKKRGLGRGLNALFEDQEEERLTVESVSNQSQFSSGQSTVGVEQLVPSALQPRKIFEEESLRELAESIKQHGVLQPILVRQVDNRETPYEIIAGERRWRACQMAQVHDVPVIIVDMDDLKVLEVALIENLQREDLNPVDEAMGYKRLIDEHSYSQSQLAERLGKSRSHVANILRLLSLPDVVLSYLERGELTAGHARALVVAENAADLAKQVVDNGLSVRETERLVSAQQKPGLESVPKKESSNQNNPDTVAVEQDLSRKLGMRVSIACKQSGAGKVTVAFKSLDQLDNFLSYFSED